MTTRPAPVNFYLYQYATFSEQVVLRDGDNNPRDLTGFTAKMHVRRERSDATPLFELSTADNTIVLGGLAGTVVLAVPFTDTDVTVDEDGECWVYDLVLTNTNTTPDTVERTTQGYIVAMPGVTTP